MDHGYPHPDDVTPEVQRMLDADAAQFPVFKAGQRVVWEHPQYGPTTGTVQSVAKDGSWAKIDARTGPGRTYRTRKYTGAGLAAWKPMAAGGTTHDGESR